MTMVLTAVLPEVVVQVSDRRLTYSDGRVSEADSKAIMHCRRFLVAYTGLAGIEGDTARWIAATISDSTSPADTVDRLRVAANAAVRGVSRQHRRLAVVGTGWVRLLDGGREIDTRRGHPLHPAQWSVSNFGPPGHTRREADDEFATTMTLMHPGRVTVTDEVGLALDPAFAKTLRRGVRRVAHRGGSALSIGLMLATAIRSAAAGSQSIGTSLTYGQLPRNAVPVDNATGMMDLGGVTATSPSPHDATFMAMPADGEDRRHIPSPIFVCGGAAVQIADLGGRPDRPDRGFGHPLDLSWED